MTKKGAKTDPVAPPAVDPAEPVVDDYEFPVCCGKCAHVWIAAYLPMRMEVLAQLLMSLHCPKCGTGSQHIVWMSPKERARARAEADVHVRDGNQERDPVQGSA